MGSPVSPLRCHIPSPAPHPAPSLPQGSHCLTVNILTYLFILLLHMCASNTIFGKVFFCRFKNLIHRAAHSIHISFCNWPFFLVFGIIHIQYMQLWFICFNFWEVFHGMALTQCLHFSYRKQCIFLLVKNFLISNA